jgi:hypothetical protein
MVLPLIFERTKLEWRELVKPNPYSNRITPKAIVSRGIESFAQPGPPTGMDLSDVAIDEVGLTFPHWGHWGLVGHFGAAKILLLDPDASTFNQTLAIAAFVMRGSWHSAIDTPIAFPGERYGPFHPLGLAEKFFYSDQPLGLHCGHIVDFLAWLLHRRDIPVRRVALSNTAHVGHIFMEVQILPKGGWMYLDPDFGLALKHKGRFISARKAKALRDAGKSREIELFDIGQKAFPKPAFNFQPGFSGQIVWQPSMMADTLIAQSDYFMRTVIEKGMEDLIYLNYEFSAEHPFKIISRRFTPEAGGK